MNLIERLYENSYRESDVDTYIYFNNLDDINRVMQFLKSICCFSTDLSYDEFDYNLVKMFNKLGFGGSSVCLHNMIIGKSRYNKLDDAIGENIWFT